VRTNRQLVLDQFTRQAIPFSSAPLMNEESSLRLLMEVSEADANDNLLDVACGPGIVVCAFAPAIRQACGIDLTPAMIERAELLRSEKNLENVFWQIGDVERLPYSDASFSIVTSRYAFHHMTEPATVLSEMNRVCADGGTVLLADVTASTDPAKADCFNRMEKLRDPSHVRALTLDEMLKLFNQEGLKERKVTFYSLEVEVESLLRHSFPNPGDAEVIRELIRDSIYGDKMGVHSRIKDDRMFFSYPITVIAAGKQI
jgi:SAM-dependent methyltransferase